MTNFSPEIANGKVEVGEKLYIFYSHPLKRFHLFKKHDVEQKSRVLECEVTWMGEVGFYIKCYHRSFYVSFTLGFKVNEYDEKYIRNHSKPMCEIIGEIYKEDSKKEEREMRATPFWRQFVEERI